MLVVGVTAGVVVVVTEAVVVGALVVLVTEAEVVGALVVVLSFPPNRGGLV